MRMVWDWSHYRLPKHVAAKYKRNRRPRPLLDRRHWSKVERHRWAYTIAAGKLGGMA